MTKTWDFLNESWSFIQQNWTKPQIFDLVFPSLDIVWSILRIYLIDIKLIILGDSAVGKSKLVERFLLNDYEER